MTPLQQKLLEAIEARQHAGEVPPTIDEMQAAVGYTSRGGVFQMLQSLEDQGLVRRTQYKARSVVSTRLDLQAAAERLVAYVDRFSHPASGRCVVRRTDLEALRAALPDTHTSKKAA